MSSSIKLTRQSVESTRDQQSNTARYAQTTADMVASALIEAERGELTNYSDLALRIKTTDSHVRAELETRAGGIVGQRWVLEPGGDKPEDIAAAEFATLVVKNIPDFDKAVVDVWDAEFHGFSAVQIHWTYDLLAGAYVVSKLEYHNQRRFRIGSKGELRLVDNGRTYNTAGEPLEYNQWITHWANGVSAPPGMAGCMRPVAWAWLFKRWNLQSWVAAAERLGAPLIVGTVPRGSPETVRESLRDDLENVSTDGVAVMEDGSAIQILSAGVASLQSNKDVYETMDKEISKAILGMSGISEQGSVGSYAAVKDRRGATVEARKILDERNLSETFTRDLIRPIIEANRHKFGGKIPATPRIRWILSSDTVDLTTQPALLSAGVITVNELRASLDLDPVDGKAGTRLIGSEAIGAVAPVVQPGAPAAAPAVPTGEQDVAETALNGAQVASLLEIVKSYNMRLLTGEQARATAKAAFPTLSEERLAALIPAVQPPPPPAQGTQPAAPMSQPGGADAVAPLTISAVSQPSKSGATISHWQTTEKRKLSK